MLVDTTLMVPTGKSPQSSKIDWSTFDATNLKYFLMSAGDANAGLATWNGWTKRNGNGVSHVCLSVCFFVCFVVIKRYSLESKKSKRGGNAVFCCCAVMICRISSLL
jgi:predicted membrane channel-forming protein YqfA (hemolysin III family)